MARISKERRAANQFREKIKALLAEPEGWRHYEAQRDWLRKLLRQDENYVFTDAERRAVDRISYMRTIFYGWGGYSVQELVPVVQRYVADFGYDDEVFLNDIEHATRVTRGDMGILVGLCRHVGMDLPRFERRDDKAEAA